MQWIILAIFGLQGLAMVFDEFYYHIRRGLPQWERIGHPIDTISVVGSFWYLFTHSFSYENMIVFSGLALFSSFLVTKDEFVHSTACAPGEQWLHALLFVLHPLIFVAAGLIWCARGGGLHPNLLSAMNADWDFLWIAVKAQACLAVLFLQYQIVFWNTTLLGKRKPA
jgi:hypothetical protein